MFDALYNHLISINLLNPNQSGFRPGNSTINQLISVAHTVFAAFDCNPPLDVHLVYLDMSKVLYRVWHEGLILKLRRYGVYSELLLIIKSVLRNRKQRTLLNGKTSKWGEIEAGVSQGSILGPLFFLVYINYLTDNLSCNVKLLADDVSLFTVVHNPNRVALDMNHDSDIIKRWALNCHMSFNPDLNKQVVEAIFARKRVPVHHSITLFIDTPVMNVTQHKHLGCILKAKLSFSDHIQAAISKSRKGIGMLRLLSKYLPRKILVDLYKLYVRPYLDYGDTIYHIPHKICDYSQYISLNYLVELLETVQYSAAVATSGARRGKSREKLYDELGRNRSTIVDRLGAFFCFTRFLIP